MKRIQAKVCMGLLLAIGSVPFISGDLPAVYAAAAKDDWNAMKESDIYVVNAEGSSEKTSLEEQSGSGKNVLVFGDIITCGNTKFVLENLRNAAAETGSTVFYLDLRKNTAEEIYEAACALGIQDDYVLCENSNSANTTVLRYTSVSSSFTMPFVLVFGDSNEALFAKALKGTGESFNKNDFTDAILGAIDAQEEDPEESGGDEGQSGETAEPDILQDIIYMWPGTERKLPVQGEGCSFSVDDSSVAEVETDGTVIAVSEGTASIIVESQSGETYEIQIEVIGKKDDYDAEWEVLKIVNRERIKQGLEPLSTNSDMQKVADIRARELPLAFSHERPDGSDWDTTLAEIGLTDRTEAWGENIAAGQRTPEEVMDSWMHSEGHKANILRGLFNHIGIGYVESDRGYGNYWCQNFTGCGGSVESISVVADEGTELEVGGKISDLDLELAAECSVCGEVRLPIIDEMCFGFDPNTPGEQGVCVEFGDWSEVFTLTFTEPEAEEPPTEEDPETPPEDPGIPPEEEPETPVEEPETPSEETPETPSEDETETPSEEIPENPSTEPETPSGGDDSTEDPDQTPSDEGTSSGGTDTDEGSGTGGGSSSGSTSGGSSSGGGGGSSSGGGSGSSGGSASSGPSGVSAETYSTDAVKGRVGSKSGVITGAANTSGDGLSHWVQDATGWWLQYANGSWPKGTAEVDGNGNTRVKYFWEQVNGAWFAFDQNGYAASGWIQDYNYGNGWFYVDINTGMQTGWKQIGNYWYYLNPMADGTMGLLYTDRMTPDGYYVNADGVWVQ